MTTLLDNAVELARRGIPGQHMLLRHAEGVYNSEGKIAAGIDVRGIGGYAVWWPAAGWAVENTKTLADWPTWLLALVLPPAPRPRSVRVASAADGARNSELNRQTSSLARFVRTDALSVQDLAAAMAVVAHVAGLSTGEIELTIVRALRAGRAP
jgi:hypothetical protein